MKQPATIPGETLLSLPSGQKKLCVLKEWTLCLARSKAAIDRCRVIDLGCGTGMIAIPLAESGLFVTALDINLNALKILAFKAKERRVSLTVVCGDVENLCFSENAFDLAIASEVFEHLVNPLAFAKSIDRIVRPGGSLIVTIPNGFSLLELYRRLRRIGRLVLNRVRGLEFKAGPDAHMQWFTFGQFIRLIEASTSFRLCAKRHSNVISGFLYYVFGIRSYALEQADCWLADHLPSFLVGGWYILFRKAHTNV